MRLQVSNSSGRDWGDAGFAGAERAVAVLTVPTSQCQDWRSKGQVTEEVKICWVEGSMMRQGRTGQEKKDGTEGLHRERRGYGWRLGGPPPAARSSRGDTRPDKSWAVQRDGLGDNAATGCQRTPSPSFQSMMAARVGGRWANRPAQVSPGLQACSKLHGFGVVGDELSAR